MNCPKCGHNFKDPARVKGGQTSKRTPGPRCQVHGTFLKPDGTCSRCSPKIELIALAGAPPWHIPIAPGSTRALCGMSAGRWNETFSAPIDRKPKNICRLCNEINEESE